MRGPQPTNNFFAHSKAEEAATITVVLDVPSLLRSLADQVVRSASSVPANLAGGAGRTGKDRSYHWKIAYGSAKEVDSQLRLLIGAEAVDSTRTEQALDLVDEVPALTWRLLHPW